MHSRNYLLLLFLLFLPVAALPQGDNTDSPWAVKLQYVGEFVLHPGLSVGTDYTVISNNWFNLHWDTELGGYIHKRNNNSVYLQSTLGTRFTTGFAVFADIQVGVGYMLSMPNGDVYRSDDSGSLKLGGRPVSSHIKPTFSVLLGWDGMVNREIPVSVFTGLEAYMQTGFNHVMLTHAAFRLGVIYHL